MAHSRILLSFLLRKEEEEEEEARQWCHESSFAHSSSSRPLADDATDARASMFSRPRQLCVSLNTLQQQQQQQWQTNLEELFFFFLFLSGKLLLYDTTGASSTVGSYIYTTTTIFFFPLSSVCINKTTIKSIFARLQLHQQALKRCAGENNTHTHTEIKKTKSLRKRQSL